MKIKLSKHQVWLIILAVSVLAVFVITLFFGISMSSSRNAQLTVALPGSKVEVRQESHEDAGPRKAAGESGNSTSGDYSPIINGSGNQIDQSQHTHYHIHDSTSSEGIWVLNLDDRMAAVNEMINHSMTAEIFIAALDDMEKSRADRDWLGVSQSAGEALVTAKTMFATGVIAECVKPRLVQGVEDVCDAAFADNKYDKLIEFVDCSLPFLPPPPPKKILAYRKAAEIRREGQFLYFPTKDDLIEMKGWSPDEIYLFLNTLAHWGMLQPWKIDIFDGSVSDCSYEKHFGLKEKLMYRSVFEVKVFDEECERLVETKRCSVAYIGFDRFERFDLQPTLELAMGGPVRDWNVQTLAPEALCEQIDNKFAANAYVVAMNDRKFEGRDVIDDELILSCRVNPMLKDLSDELKAKGKLKFEAAPEPSSALLLMLGMAGLALRRRRA